MSSQVLDLAFGGFIPFARRFVADASWCRRGMLSGRHALRLVFFYKTSPLLACLFLLAVANVASSASAATQELSLRESIERVLDHNIDLRIEREDSVVAGGEIESARAAYIPDVSLSATAAHDESAQTTAGTAESDSTAITAAVSGLVHTGATYTISTDLASNRQQTLLGTGATTKTGELSLLEISQPLLKNRAIDSTRLASEQSRLALDSSESALTQRAMEVVYAVEFAYYDLVAARQQVREKQNDLLNLLTDDYHAARETEIVTTDALVSDAVALDYTASASRASPSVPSSTSSTSRWIAAASARATRKTSACRSSTCAAASASTAPVPATAASPPTSRTPIIPTTASASHSPSRGEMRAPAAG